MPEKYDNVTEKSCNLNSTICIIVAYDIFAETKGFYAAIYVYTMETHSEIVNFSHTQIFLFRLKSRKTSTHFIASGI